MTGPQRLKIQDFSYVLPEHRIAAYPLADRSSSLLLVYKSGIIRKSIYKNVAEFLPNNSLLVFNDTKVIHARIKLKSAGNHTIECFCLEPVGELAVEEVFRSKGPLLWKCMIGNARKWKEGPLHKSIKGKYGTVEITFEKLRQDERDFIIAISWNNASYTFSEILEQAGELPIPPYLKRESEPEDESGYNTVYASQEGSVAAPTAGLHFSTDLLTTLMQSGIAQEKVTLHVGAGTFRPVSSDTLEEHKMHAERIVVRKSVLQSLLLKKGEFPVIAVGTTSARTLESLYWLGVKILGNKETEHPFHIDQWMPYQFQDASLPECRTVLDALLKWMEALGLEEITGYTQLIIAPGYKFKIVDALITNFHQPNSTLLLLVAALIGERWKEIYDFALENDFRFLSYGDACLLFKTETS
ncbi:MAG: S-adenosylmethionine:tRNA ribosyltransferase-isomerase [Bacteroidetes bacterium]|nr:S-adenosylmethionine:tRNA ribosyltransferase-isomerase [Bacteroidota bacterium]